MTYGCAVMAAAGGIGMHKARAAIVERSYQAADDLAAVAPMLQGATTFTMNGQRVHFSTASTLDSAKVVLDKFESSCQTGSGGNAQVWTAIPNDPSDLTDTQKRIDKLPIFRSEDGPHGFIACMVPTKEQDAAGLLASIKGFLLEHASLQIGRLRYASVNESATGSKVTTVWTDDNFDLAALIPKEGQDAPGGDPGVMSRPTDAVRMLSGAAENTPYRVFLYETKQSPKAAIDAYDATMFAAGWVSVVPPQLVAANTHEGYEAHAYMRDGFVGYATTSVGPNGATIVGIGETATPPADKKNMTVRDSDGF
jgi:hypothetical protein